MSTDIYAVYDEQTGTIVHLHAVPAQAGQSPDHIIAMLDPGGERSLRLLKLPWGCPALTDRADNSVRLPS